MNDHGPNNILPHFGADWIKEHAQYTEDHKQSKMWDTFLVEKDLH